LAEHLHDAPLVRAHDADAGDDVQEEEDGQDGQDDDARAHARCSSAGVTMTRVPWTSTTRIAVPAGREVRSEVTARHSSVPTRTRPDSSPSTASRTVPDWPISRRAPTPSDPPDWSRRLASGRK